MMHRIFSNCIAIDTSNIITVFSGLIPATDQLNY